MKTFAFVFPGQGSQACGMLDAFANDAAVKKVVDQASEVLGMDVAHLIATGPVELLNQTVNTQPLMLTAGYAMYQAWLASGGEKPHWVAGHSLGEYTALVASQVIDFKDAIKLVKFRAEAMQTAVPQGVGAMAAILGLSDDAVLEVCQMASAQTGKIVEAVNFNAPAQVVIAGHKEAIDCACLLAKEKGAKRALPLAVSGPFHSSLLQPASDQLRTYLDSVPFKAPQIPLINNVDVAVLNDPAQIKDALVRQASSPVRWVESIQALKSQGAQVIIECGPGKVLTGLVKRIDPDITTTAIVDPDSLVQAKTLLV